MPVATETKVVRPVETQPAVVMPVVTETSVAVPVATQPDVVMPVATGNLDAAKPMRTARPKLKKGGNPKPRTRTQATSKPKLKPTAKASGPGKSEDEAHAGGVRCRLVTCVGIGVVKTWQAPHFCLYITRLSLWDVVRTFFTVW
ncbi:hypothetical protein B0H17DRAFT_1144426 [Mycena rosella]|uniref:Uncharacterized protein n=1 Tax=Mycena rosella TaxID=1033263 RepID=A0AAD7CT71_MYCRO|nr:hypothetical protein B0H17DRAFT_1144426 [Mycena rosella]